MSNNKFATKFLYAIEKFENLYKHLNNRLNANKVSKKISSLLHNKINFSNIKILREQTASILNKEIKFPNWLTADSFSKGIRLLIKNKFGVSSQDLNYKKQSTVNNIKTNKNKLAFSSILQPISFKLKDRLKSLNKYFNTKYTNYESYVQKVVSKLKVKDINKKVLKINQDEKNSQVIAVAYYSDHILTVVKVSINKNNQVLVKGIVEIPIPGHLIGDNHVENKEELADITLDLFNLLKLEKSPLLLILSSSFFKIHTFNSSDLKQISNTDLEVQSKSPYLPEDTFVEFLSMSKRSSGSKLLRAIYAKRKLIESWTDTLEILDYPIIGLVPSAPHIFDSLTNKNPDKFTILIDIEITSTSVFLGEKEGKLVSHKLPFGCCLYISETSEELCKNYFARVFNSIKIILSEYDNELPANIYVIGQGLDKLLKIDMPLPGRFKRVSEMGLSDYSYYPKRMEIHELVSKSIESTIDTLSCITSSCL